jgi:hypothetical protein
LSTTYIVFILSLRFKKLRIKGNKSAHGSTVISIDAQRYSKGKGGKGAVEVRVGADGRGMEEEGREEG